jgi:hypothetical protein
MFSRRFEQPPPATKSHTKSSTGRSRRASSSVAKEAGISKRPVESGRRRAGTVSNAGASESTLG